MRQLLFPATLWALLLLSAVARAENDSPRREASAHFQRGVDLYNDGDFRGALVEFKRAYTIWPRANVLYDVGQTEFQLLDYAAALKTMERYLAETGPSAAHRGEVEGTVETLRGRVGRIALTVGAPDCEVAIDEQPVGVTPIGQILVSVGTRKVVVHCPGRSAIARAVEVAAGETVRLAPKLPPAAPPPGVLPVAVQPLSAPRLAPLSDRSRMVVGWSLSAVLAGATVGVGATTLVEESRLRSMRSSYPAVRDQLDRQGSLTLGLAIASDALAVAGLVAVGVSTYLTVKFRRERKVRVGLAGAGLFMATTL